jgi:hypothetical protein
MPTMAAPNSGPRHTGFRVDEIKNQRDEHIILDVVPGRLPNLSLT